jgi:branched-chain amino acid transport system permease protein
LEVEVSHVRRFAVLLVVVGLLIAPQFVTRKDDMNLLVLVLIFGTLAASWNIAGGYAGLVNLGHAAFFGLGALTTRLLWLNGTLPLGLSVLAGGLAASALALLLGVPALRLRGIYFAVGTLAMAEALRLTVGNILSGVSALPGPLLRSYDLVPRYYLALGIFLVTMASTYFLMRSRAGLGILASREDEEAAQAIGIDVFRHKLLAFVLSTFFAGLAGSSFAFYHVSYYYVFPFGAEWTFDALLMTFVGGVGTLAGPFVGAAFFVVVRDVLSTGIADFHLIVFGVLFILVVLVLPGGIIEIWTLFVTYVTRLWRLIRGTSQSEQGGETERVPSSDAQSEAGLR